MRSRLVVAAVSVSLVLAATSVVGAASKTWWAVVTALVGLHAVTTALVVVLLRHVRRLEHRLAQQVVAAPDGATQAIESNRVVQAALTARLDRVLSVLEDRARSDS